MQDRYGHRISYLRVSITDRCNERCTYCMPQELQEWLPREEILTFEETLRIIRIAVELGVSKVRVTGGEPLTRRDIVHSLPKYRKSPASTAWVFLRMELCLRAKLHLEKQWQRLCARPVSNRSTSPSIHWIEMCIPRSPVGISTLRFSRGSMPQSQLVSIRSN